MTKVDWDAIGDADLHARAVGNLANGAAVAPQVAADAMNGAAASGVPAAVAMHAPTEPNDMALFHDHTAILNDSPPVRSLAASDPAVATATKDDWSNLAGVAAAFQRFSVTRNASEPGLAAIAAAHLDYQRQKAAYASGDFMGGIKAGGSRVADAFGVLFSPVAGLANVVIDPAATGAAELAPYASGSFRGVPNALDVNNPHAGIERTTPEIAKAYYKSLFGTLLMATGGPKGSAFDAGFGGGRAAGEAAEAGAAAPKGPQGGPAAPRPGGGYQTNAEGHVVDATGTPLNFKTQRGAIEWIRDTGYDHPHNQLFEVANGTESGFAVKHSSDATGPDTAPGVNPVVDELHTEAAKADAKEVADLQEQVASTATHTRTPDVMQTFLHDHVGATQEVSVDPAALIKLYSEGNPLFKDKFADIQAAVQSGSFVKIPMSQYLTETAGKPFADELNAATRFRDNGVSLNESEDLPKPVEPAAQSLVEQGGQLTFDTAETEMPASEGTGQIFLAKPNTLEMDRMNNMLPIAQEFGGRFAPGRANTAFAFKTAAGRDQFLEAMKQARADELAPMAEEIKGKPGVNVRRMAGMLGPQLYGDPTVTAAVTAKEVLQNSFDAIKNTMFAEGEKGKIDIQFDRNDRKIVFHDNGAGMAPELLSGKFLQIAGSEKGENASGGFGIAKMLFLYGNEDLHVTTMKDGVVSEMKTSGPELMNALDEEGGGPRIEVRRGADISDADRAMFPQGHGTHISLQIPKTFTDQKTGQPESIPFPYDESDVPALVHSPLFADIDVNLTNSYGETHAIEGVGSQFPAKDYTTFANVKFPWGTARIYISKEPVKGSWSPQTHILSNGLWQFSEKLMADPKDPFGKQLPFKIYVDVNPNVKPDQPGYPFGFNRQAFTETAKKDMDQIKKYIQATYGAKVLADDAADFGEVKYLGISGGYSAPVSVTPIVPQTVNAFDKLLKEGDNVEIKDGKLIVNGQELPDLTPEELQAAIPSSEELKIDQSRIDPHRVMIHDNTKLPGVDTADNPFPDETNISSVMHQEFGQRWVEFERTVGQAFLELRDNVAAIMGYTKLADEAVGISYDREFRGVSIKVPFDGMFINPLTPESDVPAEQAYGIIGTMIHELAHFKVRSHNEQFPAEMQRIAMKLQADAYGKVGFDFFDFQQRFVNDLLGFQDIVAKGKSIFDGSDISNANSGFGAGSKEQSDAGGEGDAEGLAPARQATGGGPEVPEPADQAGGTGGPGAEPNGPAEPSTGDAIGTFVGDVQRTATAAVKAAKQVEQELGLTKIFEDAKALGLTKAQFNAYSKALGAWEKEVEEKTVRKMVSQFHKEHTPDWKAAVALHLEDQLKTLNAMPSVQAYRALKEPMFKLDREELANKFPGLVLPDNMQKNGGLSLDEAAELNNFPSGSAMVQALAGLQIAITNSGSAGLDSYLKMRAKVYATEQARQMTGYDMSADAILKSAREAADSPTLEDALTGTVKDFADENGLPFDKDSINAMTEQSFGQLRAGDAAKPKTFAENMRRLGNKAEAALLKGKMDDALAAKIQQLVQYKHMRAAFSFQKEFASATKRMNQIAKKPIVGGMDQTARNHLRAIVRDVGFNVRTGQYESVDAALKGQTLADYMGILRGRGLEPVWAEIPKKNLADLTVEQFRGVDATVQSIGQLGRDEQKAYNQRKAIELTQLGDDVRDNATKIGRPFTAGEMHRLEGTMKGGIGGGARSLGAVVSRPETFLYWMDNETVGPMMKYIVAELQDGKYYKTDMIQKVGDRFRDFVKTQPKGWQHTLDDDVDVPELTYSRGADGKPIPWLRTKGEIIMMATHFGSQSNLDKLLKGFGWDEATVRDVANQHLTQADWQYVQHILNINKMLLPEVKSLYRATVGLAMKEIPAIPIPTPYGDLEGGYRHITYNWNAMEEKLPENGEEAEVYVDNDPTALHASELFGNQYRTATPPNKYTTARTGFAAPFNLDHSILHREIEAVIHDLAYRKGLIQATKVMRVPAVRQAVRESLGPEYLTTVNNWLRDIARGAQYDQTALAWQASLIRGVRRRFTMVQIGYNVATLLKHGGIALSHVGAEVGIPEFAKAMADLQNDQDLKKWVYDNSGEVRGALINLDRDVRELMTDLFRKQGFIDSWRYHAFTMFGIVKQLEASATWLAKYRTLTEKENMGHDEAVQLANKSVRDTQGAGSPVDLPQLWRGGADFWGEVGKLSNMFTGFENTATNRAWTIARRTRRLLASGGGGKLPPPGDPNFNPGKGWDDRGPAGARRDFEKIFAGVMAFFVVPALIATALDDTTGGHLKKGAKNGEIFLEHFLENTLKGLLGGSVPLGNKLAEIPRIIQHYNKTHKLDLSSEGPLGEMFGSGIQTGINAWQALHPHERGHVEDRWVQHSIETVGYTYPGGLPVKPMAKGGQYLWDKSQGHVKDKGMLEFVRGLFFGSSPEEAKKPSRTQRVPRGR